MAEIPRPKRGSALGAISLIGGAETDIDGDYNFLFVSADGHLRTENLVWNPSTLAWEVSTVGINDDPLAKYKFTAKDPTGVYFGYTDKDGAWYIMNLGEEFTLYAKGDSGFLAAWANKGIQSYDYYFNVF